MLGERACGLGPIKMSYESQGVDSCFLRHSLPHGSSYVSFLLWFSRFTFSRIILQLLILFSVFLLLQPRQNLLNAASKIGEAGHDIMVKVEDETEADSAFQVLFFSLKDILNND